MASILKVDDLRGNTADDDVKIKQNSLTFTLQEGVFNTKMLYDHQNTEIDLSLNTSSATDSSTGNFNLNLTTNFATQFENFTSYSAEDWYSNGGTANSVRNSASTTGLQVFRHFENGSARDTQSNFCLVMGELA